MDTSYCLHPVIVDDGVLYPCGKCPVCRMKYRKQMATRIFLEKSIEKPIDSYFITLTYDDQNIPTIAGRQCFNKEHLVRFLDSLRHKLRPLGSSLRYFGTCEYGEEGYRSHYHFLFFIYGEKKFRFSWRWNQHEFNRDFVQPLWPYGFTYDGRVSPASVMYCTCYALKDDEAIERDWTGFEEGRPFRLFSLRPGLGLTDKCVQWWTDYVYNDGDYRYGIKLHSGLKRPISSSIPIGIKRKIKENEPDFYEDYKRRNQANVEESLAHLIENAKRYGSLRNYTNKNGVDPITFVPDQEIITYRKALRELSKRQRSIDRNERIQRSL